jgi:hypothetical protein
MRTAARIAAFAAAVGVTFGAAALAGSSLDPLREGGGHGHEPSGGHGNGPMGSEAMAADAPTGLAVADQGQRLVASATTLVRDKTTEWAFRIIDPAGRAVTDFDVAHERKMHLIVVRRDLTGYQHLHPTLDSAGRWSVPLRLPEAGVYRVYADFSSGGRSYTLATDLFVAGAFAPRALPVPAAVDEAEGYRAELTADADAMMGATAEVSYALSRDGMPLEDIEPYLGADGHLVALREGDLAFLHVHPQQSDTPGTIRFGAELPSAGRYRLFLQFRHDGAVRTVAHTLEVSR